MKKEVGVGMLAFAPLLVTPKTEGLPTACQVQSAVVLRKKKKQRGCKSFVWKTNKCFFSL
jgi:hypothetical protein